MPGQSKRLRLVGIAPAAFAVLLVAAGPCHGGPRSEAETPSLRRTLRPLHPLVNRLISDGRETSPTFARLLLQLAAVRNVIVYIDVRMESSSNAPRGSLEFVTGQSDHRFLRIQLHTGSTAWPTDVRGLIVLLAHELFHATEVAAHDVWTVEEFRQLYQSIGWQTHRAEFETTEARNMGEAVRPEVYGVSADQTGSR